MNILIVNDPQRNIDLQNKIKEWFIGRNCCVEYTDKTDSFDDSYVRKLLELINEKAIDAVFSIGFMTQYSLFCGAMNLSYICWLPDDGQGDSYSYVIKNEWNRVFVADPIVYECLRDNECHNISFLPLGFSCLVPEEHPSDPQRDVVLWTNGGREYISINQVIGDLKDSSKGYIDGMLKARRADLRLASITAELQQYVLDDLKTAVSYSQNSFMDFNHYCDHAFFYPILDRAVSFVYYHMLISNWLVKEVYFATDGEKPYTNKELVAVGRTEIIQKNYVPLGDYKIVLFFSDHADDGVISTDLWNIMATGQFVLVSANTDLSLLEEYAPDTFRNTLDLEEKVRYYLENDDAREEKAKLVQKKVLEFGSLESRFETLFGGL